MPKPYCENATVVLAHGPWFDACLWHSAILPLQREGLRVIVAPLPFTSFEDDIHALGRATDRARGPVVLVGHSYAGAVISDGASIHDQVVGCVYLSAVAPRPGETVRQAFGQDASESSIYRDSADDENFIWATQEDYRTVLAPDCMPHQRSILEATQRPIAQACLDTPLPDTEFAAMPSWFLVSERDGVVPPSVQLLSAKRMSARIHSRPVDHAAPMTDPDAVIDIILDAAHTILAMGMRPK
jgi:pimeloyl-ACP methyl ester carboxylesterase